MIELTDVIHDHKAIVLAALLIISALGAWACRAVMRRLAVVDTPVSRSSHVVPTPRGGGLFFVLLISLGLLWLQVHFATLLAVSGGLVAALGLADDFRGLSARLRFLGQGVIALGSIVWMLLALEPLHQIDVLFCLLVFPLGVLWLTGVTSAYNFMDGIDGLAAGQAVIMGGGIAALAYLTGETGWMMAGIWLALSVFGFLIFNWAPASLFMGDVGSTFLGWLFAALSLVLPMMTEISWASLPLLLMLFLVDAGHTVILRLVRGENVTTAHRHHIYQQMVDRLGSHAAVSVLYFLVTLIALLPLSLLATMRPDLELQLALAGLGSVFLLALLVRYRLKSLGYRAQRARMLARK
ncbi:MAG: hypothetical protein CME36_16935 [unclassified Hahellaceae]|nr:hypothetical protein [Hahellaceae bacterium]|tara:strand:+ start:49000 stop:50058 length:1059 start_codon:yes stop_codon:yes gene_type:complete